MRYPIAPGTRGHILSPFEDLANPVLRGRPGQLGLRDPALFIRDGVVHLFFTACEYDGQRVTSWIEHCTSLDLQTWSQPERICATPGLCSPGNVVEADGRFVLCCQHLPVTLPRNKCGQTRHDCRIWLLESADLHRWSDPVSIVPEGCTADWRDSARMIDAFMYRHDGAWWLLYKGHAKVGPNEHGGLIGLMRSADLRSWQEHDPSRPLFGDPDDPTGAGFENPCVVAMDGRWRCYLRACGGDSPLVMAESDDPRRWPAPRPFPLAERAWMTDEVNAPMVVDARPWFGVWLMAFHCNQPAIPLSGDIGLAWSADGDTWNLT